MSKTIWSFLLFSALSLFFLPCGVAEGSEIHKIRERGMLRVGVYAEAPGLSFRDPKTRSINGLEMDIAQTVARKILGASGRVEIKEASNPAQRGQLLDEGDVDIVIANFSITEERKHIYSFSEAYYSDNISMMVRMGSGIRNFYDLRNKRVGVARNTTGEKTARQQMRERGLNFQVKEFISNAMVKAALDAGEIDCFITDYSILRGYIEPGLIVLPERLSTEYYGVAAKKEHIALVALINSVLDELRANGELDTMLRKWNLY
ncbi:MAG: transporter substrate-binding domain-containing protein [Zoogloeaceae bacterium]|jgi:putative glutamine transport system substrate-binding protein|nr:transporter substrate-binding domain-containing protein [Zoogloeaceae bacterium]